MLSLTAGDAGVVSALRPTQLRIHRREVGELAVRALIARLDGTAEAPNKFGFLVSWLLATQLRRLRSNTKYPYNVEEEI